MFKRKERRGDYPRDAVIDKWKGAWRKGDIENSYFYPILPRNNESRSEGEFIKVNDKAISYDRLNVYR